MPTPAKPMTDEHYDLLRWMTNDYQRARDVAAALYGITVQEAVDSGKSAQLGRLLQTARAHGYLDRSYTDDGRCCYRLTDKARDWLLRAQAA